jgi:hypothetical protein
MSEYLKRDFKFQENHTGSTNEVSTGYYCFTGSLADTDPSVAETNEFLGLLFKTGMGAVAASTLNSDFVPLGSYFALNTGYEKDHSSLVGIAAITTGRYEVLATGGYSSTRITKSYLDSYFADTTSAFKAKYLSLIYPTTAAAENLEWITAANDFNYAIKKFGEMPMTSSKLSSGWTYSENVDESNGQAITFRTLGERIEVREPKHGEQIAYDYYTAEKGGAGLGIGVTPSYLSFDETPLSSVWSTETTLARWPVLTTDKDSPKETEVDVSYDLIGDGLSRPVSLSLDRILVWPGQTLTQERVDDLNERNIDRVYTGSLPSHFTMSSSGWETPEAALRDGKVVTEAIVVSAGLFLEKGKVLTRINITDLMYASTSKVWICTNYIYWPGVPMMNTIGNMQQNLTRGHKFNFVKGVTVSLGATNGYDLAVGPSYEYTNTYKSEIPQNTEGGQVYPYHKTYFGTAINGWYIADKENPDLAPKSGGLQFLGAMGRSFPTVGNMFGMFFTICTPSFWKDVRDPDATNNEANTLTTNSFFTGRYSGPSAGVTFEDSVPTRMKADLLQEKTVGPTFSFHSGNIETVEESKDGKVVLKSKWQGPDITESRVFVAAESAEAIEQKDSVSSYTNYQTDTLAAVVKTSDHKFISISGTEAATITDWGLSGVKIDFDKPDIELVFRMDIADFEREYGMIDLETGFLASGNSEMNSHVQQLQAKIDLLKTDNQAYLNKSELKLQAAEVKKAGAVAMKSKLNVLRVQLAKVKTNLKHTKMAVSESEAAAIDASTYAAGCHCALIANNADPGV